jgi:FtsZ-binding cell division protein ZapB
MTEPIFWLALSFFLVAISLTILLMSAIPAFQEISRASRSVQRLADLLVQELPPALDSLRIAGLEVSELTEELNQGARAVQQVGEGAKQTAQKAKSTLVALKAGWQAFTKPRRKQSRLQNPADQSLK